MELERLSIRFLGGRKILEQQLSLRKWMDKSERYHQVFEKVNFLTKIQRPPKLSVIIISWRLHPDTITALRQLHAQRDQVDFEIIFVNNGGASSEFDMLIEYIDIIIELNENTGAYLARNIGALFSQAPIILFLEDDGIPDEQLIIAHYLTHQRFDVIAVQGVYLYKTTNLWNELQHHYYYGNRFFSRYSDLEGNSSYRSDAFFRVGGWDDDIRFGGGGVDLAIRLYEVYPLLTKQLYSPICVLSHDYATDQQHYDNKRAKQLKSHSRLSEKHRNWDHCLRLWDDLFGNEQALKWNDSWSLEQEATFKCVSEEVFERNRIKANQYMYSRLFLSDPSKFKEHVHRIQLSHRVAIFGAGEYGQKVYKEIVGSGANTVVFVDNNSDLWGKTIDQAAVISPESLTKKDYIFIASMWKREIADQLRYYGFEPGLNYCYVL